MDQETRPNAGLAYRVLDHIDAYPEQWDQGTWDCGTAACFAGWAVRLSGGVVDTREYSDTEGVVVEGPEHLVGRDVQNAAVTVLGTEGWTPSSVRPDAEDWLFSSANSREDLGRLVAEIFGPRPESCPCADGVPTEQCSPRGCAPADDVPPNAGAAAND